MSVILLTSSFRKFTVYICGITWISHYCHSIDPLERVISKFVKICQCYKYRIGNVILYVNNEYEEGSI
jgi:hypothetical protein